MPKCPNCKEEIEELRNIVSGSNEYTLFSIGNDTEYEEKDFAEDYVVNEYWCPECQEVLFTDEEKAIDFLKGINQDELTKTMEEKLKQIKEKKNVNLPEM